MTYQFIELEISEQIATVCLARVDALNALSTEFGAEITRVFRELGTMDEVRAIILKSKARIFSCGLDLKATLGLAKFDGTVPDTITVFDRLGPLFECCDAIEECPKPVIAAVHGKCVGGGLDLISACDIRLCTEDAVFCLKEAGIGLVADMGVLQRLPHIIGQGFTREMAFTAAEFSAGDAERMGLVNGVHADVGSLEEAARKLALRIASIAPLAVSGTKQVLNSGRFENSVREGMNLAIHKNMVLIVSEDLKEAVTAFLEKRSPDFKGR